VKKNTREAIVVIVIIMIGTVCFIAAETALEWAENHTHGNYDYALSTTIPSGEVMDVPDGMVYIAATVMIKNIDWHNGLSGDPSYFRLDAGGEGYPVDDATYDRPLYHSPATYLPGEQGQNLFLYLVPSDTDLAAAHITYTGPVRVAYAPGLLSET